MFTLKPISPDSVEGALAKAERYRLLNEPDEAESICRDILQIDPGNREAQISTILALTDQLHEHRSGFSSAIGMISDLASEYDRAYYAGIAWERRAKAHYGAATMGSATEVHDWLIKALDLFEKAEHLRPSGNDDAILRWNACVRFLDRHKELQPSREEIREPVTSE
jgi:tetratricopeptide (TPR) repeat protein